MVICPECGIATDAAERYPGYRQCKACVIGKVAEWKRQKFGRPGFTPTTCEWCGNTWRSARRDARHCSRNCAQLARNQREKEERKQIKAEAPPRRCRHCGTPLRPEQRVGAKFCSERCNSAAHQITRKLARRAGKDRNGELFDRVTIAERDGWRCGLCRKPIDRKLRHPDPFCLSIDHIVPVADDGDNDPANLQAAHLRCNLSKRDRGAPQQLALFG